MRATTWSGSRSSAWWYAARASSGERSSISMARSDHSSALSGGSSVVGASRSFATRPPGCDPATRSASKLNSSWPDSGFQRRAPSQATTRSPSLKTLSRVSGRSPSWRRRDSSARPIRRSGTCCSRSARVVRRRTRSRKSKRRRPWRSRSGATSPARTHWRNRPGGRPTMRAACAVSKRVRASARPRSGTLLLLVPAHAHRARPSARGPSSLGGDRHRSRRGAPTLAGEALLERLHDVDDLGRGAWDLGHRHFLTRNFPVHRFLEPLAPVVVILLGRELLARELLDQLASERGLRRLHRGLRAAIDLVERAHLVGVVQRVQRESVGVRADQDEALLAACHVLRQR